MAGSLSANGLSTAIARAGAAILPATLLELAVDAQLSVEQDFLHVEFAERRRGVKVRLACVLGPHARYFKSNGKRKLRFFNTCLTLGRERHKLHR